MFWFLKCHALLVLFMLSRYGNCKVFKRVRNKVVRFFSMVKWSNTCITIVTEVPSTSETVIVTIEEPVTKKRCKVVSESVPTFLEQMVNSSPSQQTKNIEKKKTNNSLPGNTAGKEIILEGKIYLGKMCRRQVQTRSKKLFMMEWITKQWPYVPIDSDESWQCRIIDKSHIH